MIKFNEIIKDKEYRERIIKYFKLPIRLSVSEEKFISDLEFLENTRPDVYNRMVELIEHDFNREAAKQGTTTPDFTMENILEPLIEEFESNPKWEEFLKQDYSDALGDFTGITNTQGFYKKENDRKHFISVDLRAANWQSLQAILRFDKSYEEMIVQYTSNLIPPASKTFRTKITGILGAKQIMDYNKKLLNDNRRGILEAIHKITGVDLRGKTPFAFYADEFLIEIDKETKDQLCQLNLSNIENDIYNETGIKIHLTPFTLKWLDIEKGCVKLYKDKKYEVINLSKDISLILNKLIHNAEIKEIDFEKIKLNGQTQKEYIGKISKVLTMIEDSLE